MSQPLSQTLSQSQRPACIQCGGTDYVLESGYYFCADCQVQSQDIREEVFDEYTGGQRGIKVAIPGLKSQELPAADVSIPIDKPELTSWEALNIVLHGLVNELILLGAPKELKIVVLQLWARYLMKTEAAFTSKRVEKRPCLSLTFRKGDAQLLYGTDRETLAAQKRPIFRHKRRRSPSRSDSESSKHEYSTKRTEKYMLTMKKKKLATAEYAASTSASSQGSELTLENLSAMSPNLSAQKTKKCYKLHYSKKAKEDLLKLLDNGAMVEDFDRGHLQKRVFNRHASGLEHVTIQKLLVILRLSLLILESDIHLGDLLRWSDEGYLSLLNGEKLIPCGVNLTKDAKYIFVTTLKSRRTINSCVMNMAKYLDITDLKSRILPLIERYMKELCLPGEIFSIIKRIIALKPPTLSLSASVNYEARALSYIIFVLKFLFGLDGETEKRLSKFASIVNRDNTLTEKHFVWADWVRFINCRNSFLSVHHQVSRDVYYPTSSFGGFNAFLSHWENVPTKQTISREHVIDNDLSECMRRVLKGLYQKPNEPLAPSLAPLSSMTSTILRRNLDVPSRTRKIIQHDFTLDSIRYLTDKRREKKLCEIYGAVTTSSLVANFVKVKPVSVQSSDTFPLPSIKGKKKNVSVKLIEGNSKGELNINSKLRSNSIKLRNKKSTLPDADLLTRGIFFSNKSAFTEDGIILPKLGRGFWIYHGSFSNAKTQMATFNHFAEIIFPPDFFWLLKETAHIGNVSPKDLYSQLTEVEKMYLQYLPHGKKARGSFRNW